jgi:DNA invertase Pin-like site-specific DNA recombinase
MAAGNGERPVAGYIRVSRIGGRSGEGYISPDEQRQQIERYASELGVRVADDAWGDDQDYSGGNFNRPGWEGIVKRIESGELGGVIVLRVDRFARTCLTARRRFGTSLTSATPSSDRLRSAWTQRPLLADTCSSSSSTTQNFS